MNRTGCEVDIAGESRSQTYWQLRVERIVQWVHVSEVQTTVAWFNDMDVDGRNQ